MGPSLHNHTRVALAATVLGLVALSHLSASAATVVSGSDRQVKRTTLATDPTGRAVVVLWESTQFTAHEHIRLNRSTDGGARWRPEPIDFPLNVVNPWFSDYLPEVALDEHSTLHVLWSQRSDTTSPRYARSPDLGDTWPTQGAVGGGNLPRWLGLAMTVSPSGEDIWTFHHDTNWHAYACRSQDGGTSWTVHADHDGAFSAGDPPQTYCSDAATFGRRHHVLRKRGNALELLSCEGDRWSACAIPGGDTQPNLAADHTIAVDDLGHVFAVFASNGSAFCARSDDAGACFAIPTAVAPDDHGEQSLPVIALLPNNRVAVAWQQTTGQNSEVRYAISADGGATFEPSQALEPALSNQTAPDICAAGDTLYYSFTQDGQAIFARVPEAPPPAPLAAVAANLVSDPAFDQFDGPAPGGWTVDSWNQEFLQERFGRAEPGRDGTGACLELQAGSGASIINFTGPEVPVEGDSEYFFKGYYASTCERVSVKGEWLNDAGEPVRTFEIRLPETQDEWIHFIKQLSSPVFATKLRLGIEKKWQSGRVRFDDFSLRRGTVTDYATEFDLPDSGSTDPWLPIFSWLGPYSWPQLGPEMAAQLDRDEYHLDYALAGFNVGYRARFGLRYHPSPPADAAAVAHLNADPAVWVYHAGDEPSEAAFPRIASQARLMRELGAVKPLWYNLLPTYGFRSYEDYEHHIRAYLDTVKPAFITYDHYCLSAGNKSYGRDFFANIEIVRRECQARDVDWGIILQLVAFGGMRSPDEAELRWQAFCSLASGARAIGWFTYLTEVEYGGMNWRDAVIDHDGFRTRHYSMLARVNRELQHLGRTLVRLRSTGVYHTEPLPELTSSVSAAKLVHSVDGGELLIGEFVDDTGTPYIMIVNRDFTTPVQARIILRRLPAGVLEISKSTGEPVHFAGAVREFTVALPAGDGRLLQVQP